MQCSLVSCLVKAQWMLYYSMPTTGEISGEKGKTDLCLCGSGESIWSGPQIGG